MANEHEYEDIDYHSDNSERHAACNVKFYGHIDVEPHEAFAQQAWDRTVEQFWEMATEMAHEAGYSCVFSEGRSGGWLVPFRQIGMDPEEVEKRNLRSVYVDTLYRPVPLFWNSPGQGGTLGYPRYPDMDDIGERSRFRAFAKRVEKLMDAVPQMIQDEAQFLVEEAVESFA